MEKINGVYAINNAIQNGGRPAELTRKQIEEKHGEVVSYELGKPHPWEVVSTWPKDIQREYFKKLYWTYCGSLKEIGDILGLTFQRVASLFDEFSLPKRPAHAHKTPEEKKTWSAFLRGGTLVKDLIPKETADALEKLASNIDHGPTETAENQKSLVDADATINVPKEQEGKAPLEDNPALAIATVISQLRGTGARISIEIVL